MTNTPTKQRIRQILDLLRGEYGVPEWQARHDPISVLVQTILSQNTSDANSRGAFLALLNAFDNWQDVADADVGTIAYCIPVWWVGKDKGTKDQRSA